MPSNPLRPCRAPGCSALVTSGYCAAHARQSPRSCYDATKRRDDPTLANAARIRSSATWQRVRRQILAAHPFCADPFGRHRALRGFARDVHHIKPLAERPDLAFEPTNLAPLCTACHRRIEAMERAGRPTAQLFTNPPYSAAAGDGIGRVEKLGAPRPTPTVLPFFHVRKM